MHRIAALCVVRCVGHLALPVATSLRCNFWQISCCFVQKTIVAKGKMEAKAEGRCVRCKKFLRAMLKNREGHHSDDAVKKGIWIAL